MISTHCVGAITNRDTIWSELEAVILALLVLGRKMRQLWVGLESKRAPEYIREYSKITWRARRSWDEAEKDISSHTPEVTIIVLRALGNIPLSVLASTSTSTKQPARPFLPTVSFSTSVLSFFPRLLVFSRSRKTSGILLSLSHGPKLPTQGRSFRCPNTNDPTTHPTSLPSHRTQSKDTHQTRTKRRPRPPHHSTTSRC